MADRSICLVAREYLADDFREHLSDLIAIAEKQRCESLMLSLFSLDRKASHEIPELLERCHHLKNIILETGDLTTEEDLQTEVWVRHLDRPFIFKRQFAQSSEPPDRKSRLVQQLPYRVFGESVVLICGEANILKVDRRKKRVVDQFGVLPKLEQSGVRFVLNGWHTKAFRYEINEKRKALSKGRLLVSVWNTWKERGRDGKIPWIAYANGNNITGRIRELDKPIIRRPDIRVGILQV